MIKRQTRSLRDHANRKTQDPEIQTLEKGNRKMAKFGIENIGVSFYFYFVSQVCAQDRKRQSPFKLRCTHNEISDPTLPRGANVVYKFLRISLVRQLRVYLNKIKAEINGRLDSVVSRVAVTTKASRTLVRCRKERVTSGRARYDNNTAQVTV